MLLSLFFSTLWTKQTYLWARCSPGLLLYSSSLAENKGDWIGENNSKNINLEKCFSVHIHELFWLMSLGEYARLGRSRHLVRCSCQGLSWAFCCLPRTGTSLDPGCQDSLQGYCVCSLLLSQWKDIKMLLGGGSFYLEINRGANEAML